MDESELDVYNLHEAGTKNALREYAWFAAVLLLFASLAIFNLHS